MAIVTNLMDQLGKCKNYNDGWFVNQVTTAIVAMFVLSVGQIRTMSKKIEVTGSNRILINKFFLLPSLKGNVTCLWI